MTRKAWFVLGWLALIAAGSACAVGPPPRDSVDTLVQQLGSDRYAAREGAARRLEEAPFAEIPDALQRALRSDDLEVRLRASRIVAKMHNRIAEQAMRRGLAAGRRGEVDLLVEGLAGWPRGARDERSWRAVLDCAWAIAGRAGSRWAKPHALLTWVFDNFRDELPKARAEGSVLRLGDGEQHIRLFCGNAQPPDSGKIPKMAVCGDDAQLPTRRVAGGVLLVNGDGVADCSWLVVSAGNVFASDIREKIVIARGHVYTRGPISRSVVIAGGAVTAREVCGSVVKQHDPHPLGFVRFFETARAGVEVAPAKFAVRATRVAPGGPFDKAGLRPGDLITSFDEAETPTPEALRRLLRRRYLQRGTAELTARRGGAALTLRVRFPAD